MVFKGSGGIPPAKISFHIQLRLPSVLFLAVLGWGILFRKLFTQSGFRLGVPKPPQDTSAPSLVVPNRFQIDNLFGGIHIGQTVHGTQPFADFFVGSLDRVGRVNGVPDLGWVVVKA